MGICLHAGNVPTKNITTDQLANRIKSYLRDMDVVTKKVTHNFRYAAARNLDENGHDDAVILRLGKWLYDAMYKSYLLFFKPEGLLGVGGWPGAPQKDYHQFWAERFFIEPPASLTTFLFPFLPGECHMHP